jgi:beta-propeller repeat-containing protein
MSSNTQIVSTRSVFAAMALMCVVGAGSPHASAWRSDTVQRTAARAVPVVTDLNHSGADALRAFSNLPLAFVENRGQTDSRVRFYAQGNRRAFFVTSQSIVLLLANSTADEQLALSLRFVGGDPTVTPEGAERAAGAVNYLHGSDPAGWRTGLARYGEIVYRELWPGIDLRLHDVAGTLKYEFRVHPGANPARIQLAYEGANGLSIDPSGAVRIDTAMGVLKDAAPISYQMVGRTAVPVDTAYELTKGANGGYSGYGFGVGGYQPDHELVIDPGLEYSTFLGGASDDMGNGIKVDASGNAFIVGTTQSPNFPTTAGALRRTGAVNNSLDAFVSKINAAGTALIYSTFIGGSNFEWGRAIAIDAAGSAYITGQTKSSNFPTTAGAFDRTFNIDTCPRCGIDQEDAFVLKLNPAGSALVYSTFLGGFNMDDGMAIAVDAAGNAYVAGETEAVNFPTTANAFDRTINGAFDTFVTKLNATGSALVYSTYLGGSAVEFPSRVAVDAAGNLFIAGSTSSTDFPTTAGAFDTSQNGAFDVFLTKLNAAGSGLVFSTFLGGSGFDSAGGLALDSAGNSYVSGGAGSVDFPSTPGAFDTLTDGNDAFVTKFNPSGSALVYSTFLGGSSSDGASGLALDGAGNAWVTGGTTSTDFPIIVGAVDGTHNGMSDVFVSELNNTGTTLLYSTFLGGSDSEGGSDIAVDTSGGVYVTGHTFSLNYPTTAGAFDTVWNGDMLVFWGDGFVSKIGAVSSPPSTPPVPAAPALLSPANGANEPQPINFQWAVASGAASYTIQIDDSSAFTAPLVREQQNITTLLIYATSGLSTAPHFWRVRGVNFDGVAGPWSAVRTVNPGTSPPPPGLGSIDINPTTIVGGNASSGTVVLSTGAPFGGAVINLSSSNPSVASVPATVTAPENSFVGLFTISTSPVAANTTVTITASYNGTTRSGTLTVTPAGAPQGSLSMLSVTSPITGGSTAQGSVLLTAVAQADAVVSLSSSNASVASVPSTVTVPAANQVGVFTVSTSAVSTSTTVTITASFNGGTRTATVTVSPAAPPPPPPQTATLTVTASGRSGERVSSTPTGINVSVGSSGSASFATGTSITLGVSNGRDAIWSGACSSGGAKQRSCTFTINGNAAVTGNIQ